MEPNPNLTDEQLAALLEQHTRVSDPHDQNKQPAQLKYRLGNQEFTAASPEELQAQLDAAMNKIGETVQTLQAKAQPAPAAQPAAPSLDRERYAKLFLEDPVQAAEYLDEIRFGMQKPSSALKAVISDVGGIEQSLAVQRFMNENSDYEATPQNFQALMNTMQAYGLPWDYNGMTLAYKAAKADGHIQAVAAEPADDPRFAPQFNRRGAPVVPRGAQQSSPTVEDGLLDRFMSMEPDQMKAFLSSLPVGR